ncbi:MAG TPA: Tm-1-like ATP-binding domain-containing protein [Isosphaeraceae bacterium]|nr:Tm-1-like ATP-binding domain-containing protein [Isosphaeraceae bacterium]
MTSSTRPHPDGSSVYAVATMDTKGHELCYVAERLRAAGIAVVTIDVGTKELPVATPDVDRATVADSHPTTAGRIAARSGADRGQAITAMSDALRVYLRREHELGRVAGVIGIGGSGGTALITPAMRALPIGLPKLMVSTVASGNVAPYVDFSDITMMYSVVDIAGLNAVSRRVLGNAAAAMAGMVQHPVPTSGEKPALGLTMFGVTTPCVTAVREALEAVGFDCLVFHATGTGGRAMEALVEAGLIQGVLDITTTEVADEVVGGILPAGPHRFEAILRAEVPYVLSLGALDMVNFGALATVPEPFRNRRLQVHNAQVTLMRTTPEENRRAARWIAAKLNRARAPFRILIPEGGLSAIDAPGQPFHDPEADAALFDELESAVLPAPGRLIRRLPFHINDPGFAQALVEEFLRAFGQKDEKALVPAGPPGGGGERLSSPWNGGGP